MQPELVLTKASQQWATRPADQRFLSIADLKASVLARKQESWTVSPQIGNLRVLPTDDGLAVQVYDPTQGMNKNLYPTNWAFGQLAGYVGAPASYLRKLPPEIAAIDLQWGLEHDAVRPDGLLLAQSNGSNIMRAITSNSYGRIWDAQVVEAVENINHGNRWVVPSASYTASNPLRATTLYASDRDIFMFLVDDKNVIEVNDDQLYRGFYVFNSEVGSAVFGLATFLYRVVCDNRMIWGAQNYREINIRHTGGAPDRFLYEGEKYLEKFANGSTQVIEYEISKAQETAVPLKVDQTPEMWLQERGFTKSEAGAAITTAIASEGEARTVWQVINGVTAYARSIQHTDLRVGLEKKAGSLMSFATG